MGLYNPTRKRRDFPTGNRPRRASGMAWRASGWCYKPFPLRKSLQFLVGLYNPVRNSLGKFHNCFLAGYHVFVPCYGTKSDPGQFLVGLPIPPATPIFGMRDSDFGADQLRNIQKLSMRNLYFSWEVREKQNDKLYFSREVREKQNENLYFSWDIRKSEMKICILAETCEKTKWKFAF